MIPAPLSNAIRTLTSHPIYQLIIQTMTYGFGSIVQKAMGLILLPIYTRYLTPESYGVTAILGVTALILGTISVCALTNGIGRYFFYPDQEKTTIENVIWSPFFFVIGFSLIILVPVCFAAGPISVLLFNTDRYAYLVILTAIGVFITNLSGIGSSLLIFQQRAMTLNILNIFNVIIGVAAGLFFVVFLQHGVNGVVEAGLLTSVVMVIPILSISLFKYRPTFSREILRKELVFSLPLVAALVAFLIIDSSSRYFLAAYWPLSEVGLFNVGNNIGMVMAIIVGGFTSAWPPYYHQHNQNGEGQSFCNNVLRVYLIVCSTGVVALSLAAPLLLIILTTPQFYPAAIVVPLIAVSALLKGPYLIFLVGVQMKNRTDWQLGLECLGAVVSILFNLALIPVLGGIGAAITLVVSYSVLCIGAYWVVMRINPIPNLSKKFFITIAGLTILIAGFMTGLTALRVETLWIDILIIVLFCATFLPLYHKEFGHLLKK